MSTNLDLLDKEGVLLKECRKCAAPLGHESKIEGFQLCHTCRFCQVCNGALNPTETRIPFQKTEGTEGSIFVSHIRCSPFAPRREIPVSTVVITQAHLDYLNAFRLCIEPEVQFGVETNRQNASLASRKLVSEMDPDTLLILVARLEMFMADVSVALSRKMVSIKAIQSERDSDSQEQALSERIQANHAPKTTKKRESREATASKVLEGALGKNMALEFQLKMAALLKGPTPEKG